MIQFQHVLRLAWICLLCASARGAAFPGPASFAATAPDGKVWIAGGTISRSLPASAGAVQPKLGWEKCLSVQESECQDLFLARLSSTGDVEKLTYLGAEGFEHLWAMSFSPQGDVVYLYLQTTSSRLLGRDLRNNFSLLVVALSAGLDSVLYVSELPEDFVDSSAAFASNGEILAVTEEGVLASFDSATRAVVERSRLGLTPGWVLGFSYVTVSPDGDVYVRFSEVMIEAFEERWWVVRYGPDGRTEKYRVAARDFAAFRPMPGGTVWFSTWEWPRGMSRLGQIQSNGTVEYLATLQSVDAPHSLFPRGVNEVWFSGWTGQALRTTDNAPRHCRVGAEEGFVGRLLVAERRVDYLAFAGRSDAVNALVIQAESAGARLLVTGRNVTEFVAAAVGAGGTAAYCLDANIDNLALAGERRGIGAGLCAGPCGGDTADSSLLAPGMMIAIPGRGLGPAVGVKPAPGALPRELAGTRLLLDGQPVALLAVREDRIDAVVPFAVKPGSKVRFTVERHGRVAGPTEAAVAEANPEIFKGSGGTGLFRSDGTEVSQASPAKGGERLAVFMTGAGRLEKEADESRPVEGRVALALPVRAYLSTFSDAPLELVVDYAGLVAGQLPGLVQVNVRLPERIAGGSNQLAVFVGERGFAPVWFEAESLKVIAPAPRIGCPNSDHRSGAQCVDQPF